MSITGSATTVKRLPTVYVFVRVATTHGIATLCARRVTFLNMNVVAVNAGTAGSPQTSSALDVELHAFAVLSVRKLFGLDTGKIVKL